MAILALCTSPWYVIYYTAVIDPKECGEEQKAESGKRSTVSTMAILALCTSPWYVIYYTAMIDPKECGEENECAKMRCAPHAVTCKSGDRK